MSIPVVPGYLESPPSGRLVDLWKRPTGEYPDELWPHDELATIVHEPTGWLTVCEHHSSEEGSGGRGCVLVAVDHSAGALENTGWVGRNLGTLSLWEGFDGQNGFEDGLKSIGRDVDLEFFVQVKRPVGSPDSVLDLSHPFLWYFDAYPVRNGWAYLNEAGRPQELVRTQVEREHWVIEVRALEFRQFLYACGRHAFMQVDLVPQTSSTGFDRVDDDFRNEWP